MAFQHSEGRRLGVVLALIAVAGLVLPVASGAIETKKSRRAKGNKGAVPTKLTHEAFQAGPNVGTESKAAARAAGDSTPKTLVGPGSYSTGFEPPFALGTIDGQFGWTVFISGSSAAEEVSSANPFGGSTQHFRINKDGTIGSGSFTGGFSPDLGPLASGSSTTSVEVSISGSGGADYLVAGQSPSETLLTWQVRFRFTGPIQVFDDVGAGFGFQDTGVVWSTGSYKNLTVCFDPSGAIEYFYDGVHIWSQVGGLVGGTRVEQVVLVSDNFQNPGETGDFDDLSIAPGLSGLCTAGAMCDNNNQEIGEECDGSDSPACQGLCQMDCTCPAPFCGNDVVEAGEECDGTSLGACPGGCEPNCTCSAPPGDDCTNAVGIDCGASVSDSNVGYANDFSAVSGCTGFTQNGPDKVYEYVATDDCTVTVTATPTDGHDPSVYVLTDCGDPAGSCIAGADSGLGGDAETLMFLGMTGNTYYIVVDGYYSGGGSYDLDVSCVCGGQGACCSPDGSCNLTLAGDCNPPDSFSGVGTSCVPNLCPQPCNPDFSQNIACSTGPHFLAGSTVGETDSCDDLGGLSADHIWELTVTEPGFYSFDMCTNAPGGDPCAFDSFIFLEDSCCGGIGSVLAADDDCPGIGCFGSSLIECLQLDIGTYYLVVEGYGALDEGAYNVTVSCCAQGPDECENRLPIPCDGNNSANNCTASPGVDDPTPSCTIGADFGSVFFEFMATDTSARIRTDLNSVAGDSGYGVYSVNQADPCDESQWVEVGCSEDEGLGFNGDICVNGLTVGETYVIMLVSFSAGSCGEYTVDVTCPCPAPPPNDDCGDAIAVGVPSTTAGTTEIGTTDAGFDQCGDASISSPGVWYSVVGTGNTMTASLCNGVAAFDTKLSVYCPDCADAMCVAGVDDSCNLQSEVSWCSQSGATYLVLVHGFGGQTGPFELEVSDDGFSCAASVKCLPEGACCNGANCTIETETACTMGGGTYVGDDTSCLDGAPVTVYQAAPNLPIPDGDPAGVSHQIVVADSYNATDVNIDVAISHTFIGDLIVTVTHNGTPVTVVDRPGFPTLPFGCSSNDLDIILDDTGTGGPVEDLCGPSTADPTPGSPPNYTPSNPLSALAGLDVNGVWEINVSDNEGLDVGALLAWSIHAAGEAPDTDGDGIIDLCDDCPNDPDNDADGDGVCGDVDVCPGFDDNVDADGDTVPDGCDICPGGDDMIDSDNDDTPDFCDGCPNDPGKTDPGQCGCGNPDDDTDNDGTADCNDGCPQDPNKIDPGICGCGIADQGDSDNDGVLDCVDVCPGADDAVFGACPGAIPTVSEWGLAILALTLLVGAKLAFRRRTALS